MDRFKEGLIIGKFMPIHAGHQHLIDTGKARVERLTVLVCSHYWEPVPGEKRYEWVKEMNPDVNVVGVSEELPSQPEEHPDFWDIWRRAILKYAPRPDVIFSSEDYGYKLAEVLGCVHICVDPRRERYHISGEKVRADPYKWWDFIPSPVKAYYAKRICIVGPESTGKTTLATALAERLNTVWVPEYAVEYLKTGNGDLKSLDDIENIARGQIESEDAVARQANRVLICDTDLMTTAIWSKHYFGSCPEWIVRESFDRKYDLYLLTDIDIPWVESLWRDCPDKREHFLRLFSSELELRKRRFTVISGDTPERRLDASLKSIENLFPQGMVWLADERDSPNLRKAVIAPSSERQPSINPKVRDEQQDVLKSNGCNLKATSNGLRVKLDREYRSWAEHAAPLVNTALQGSMEVPPESPSAEAWLTYSLYSTDMELDLQELLEVADSINVLMPTPNELSWTLLQLRKRGWLTEHAGKYGLTDEARDTIRTIVGDGVVFDELKRLEEWIAAHPRRAHTH